MSTGDGLTPQKLQKFWHVLDLKDESADDRRNATWWIQFEQSAREVRPLALSNAVDACFGVDRE